MYICTRVSGGGAVRSLAALENEKKMLTGDNQCEWLITAGGRQRVCLSHFTVNRALMLEAELCVSDVQTKLMTHVNQQK